MSDPAVDYKRLLEMLFVGDGETIGGVGYNDDHYVFMGCNGQKPDLEEVASLLRRAFPYVGYWATSIRSNDVLALPIRTYYDAVKLVSKHRGKIEALKAENEELRRRLSDYELAEVTPADLAASLGAAPVVVQTREEFDAKLPPDPNPSAKVRDRPRREVSGAPPSKNLSKLPRIRTKPKGW